MFLRQNSNFRVNWDWNLDVATEQQTAWLAISTSKKINTLYLQLNWGHFDHPVSEYTHVSSYLHFLAIRGDLWLNLNKKKIEAGAIFGRNRGPTFFLPWPKFFVFFLTAGVNYSSFEDFHGMHGFLNLLHMHCSQARNLISYTRDSIYEACSGYHQIQE